MNLNFAGLHRVMRRSPEGYLPGDLFFRDQSQLNSHHWEIRCRNHLRQPWKPIGAIIYPTFTFDKLVQRFRMVLVLQGVPEHTRPLGPGPFIYFCRIRSAANDGGKWLLVIEWSHIAQSQSLVSSFEGAFLSRPPRDQIEDSYQIDVDCTSVPAPLTLVPGVLNPQEILLQCLIGIRNTETSNSRLKAMMMAVIGGGPGF